VIIIEPAKILAICAISCS